MRWAVRYFPASIEDIEGSVQEDCAVTRSNSTPRAASASRFGLVGRG
jgi:hypothetical protein